MSIDWETRQSAPPLPHASAPTPIRGALRAHIEATVTKMVNGYQTHSEKCAVSPG